MSQSLLGRIKSTLDVLSTVAVLVAAGVLLWKLTVKPPARAAAGQQIENVQGLRIEAAKITHTIGNGPIAIVEFSDFQCPFCGSYVRETLPAVKRELVDSGKIRYVALNYPLEALHPLALQAGEAAECAGRQKRFWEMYDRLFADAKALTTADLVEHARALGLDQSHFEQCLAEHLALESVRGDQAEGRRLGVKGTPAFFIGTVRPDGAIDVLTRIQGAVPPEQFVQQIATIDSQSRRTAHQ